jgi:hypothetical protein
MFGSCKRLKNNHFAVEFICRTHDGNLINRICEDGFKVHELQLGSEDNTDLKLEHSSLAWGLTKTGCGRLH